MTFRCPHGCEVEVGMSQSPPGRCSKHGELFVYTKALNRSAPVARTSPKTEAKARKRGTTLKRSQRRETAAEKRARQHFNETVKAWPCFFREHRTCRHCGGAGRVSWMSSQYLPEQSEWIRCTPCDGLDGHRCSGPKDAHHLVEKQWIRRNYADLPEDELLAILFCPQIGAPLCRAAHDGIKANPIYWHELTPECVEFCEDVDRRYLEKRTPAGLRRESMVVRLRRECPVEKGALAA